VPNGECQSAIYTKTIHASPGTALFAYETASIYDMLTATITSTLIGGFSVGMMYVKTTYFDDLPAYGPFTNSSARQMMNFGARIFF
jgi:hypothetical protein